MDAAKTVFIILAGGSSSRLGRPKQLLFFDGLTLIKHAVKTAFQLNPLAVIIVSGFLHDELVHELDGTTVEIVENKNWEQGMGSSIIAGIGHFKKSNYQKDAKNLVVMLSDQPLITPTHLLNLICQIDDHQNILMAATSYQNIIGVPAAYSICFLPQLSLLAPGKGAQQLFNKYPDVLVKLQFDAAAVDIDTEDDYSKLLLNHSSN